MSEQKYSKRFKFALIIPIILMIVGIMTMYYYQFFLFSEKFQENGNYFLLGIISVLIILILLPYLLFKKQISKKGVRRLLLTLESLLSVVGIVFIIGGSAISILFMGADHYDVGPILTWGYNQNPSNEITVMWRTTVPGSSIVYYGESPLDMEKFKQLDSPVEWHRVALSNLLPNTTYYYRVEGLAATKVHSFTTAPEGPSEFSVILFSDPRQNTSPLNIVLTRNYPQWMMDTMKSQGIRPAFTIACGDVTTFATTNASWRSWFRDIAESGMASDAPLQIAPGNHEREYNDTGEIFASLYPYQNDLGFNYAYNYSSVHVLMLDPWNFTVGGYFAPFTPAQLAWIEQDLQNAQSIPYRIIAMHHPIVHNNEVVEMYAPLVELCDKYHVDAVFFGHDHDFGMSYRNNTHYFLIGVGGNSFIGPTGFIQLDIKSTNMQVDMQWLNGTRQALAKISN